MNRDIREFQGGVFAGTQNSPAVANRPIWAKLTAYDGSFFYEWQEVTPQRSGSRVSYVKKDGGLASTQFSGAPAFEPNGSVLSIPSIVLLKRAYLDPELDWVYVVCFESGSSFSLDYGDADSAFGGIPINSVQVPNVDYVNVGKLAIYLPSSNGGQVYLGTCGTFVDLQSSNQTLLNNGATPLLMRLNSAITDVYTREAFQTAWVAHNVPQDGYYTLTAQAILQGISGSIPTGRYRIVLSQDPGNGWVAPVTFGRVLGYSEFYYNGSEGPDGGLFVIQMTWTGLIQNLFGVTMSVDTLGKSGVQVIKSSQSYGVNGTVSTYISIANIGRFIPNPPGFTA